MLEQRKRLFSMAINTAKGLSAPAHISTEEFDWICRFLYDRTGILLKDGKQALVMGRLDKRLRYHGLSTYADYFKLVGSVDNSIELRMMLDLLTTNETYFFREPKHFEFLHAQVLPAHPAYRLFRAWSAASSSGEEAYTLAMTLAESLTTNPWEIVGTDISSRVLETAQQGFYPMLAAEKIPERLLKKYCLKGKDEYEGFLRIDAPLRNRTTFRHANLVEPLPDLGMFDVIFLRNVMIYFDVATKQKLLERIQRHLQPGGYFFISHSESLNGLNTQLKMVTPSIYRRVVSENA
jgi:chemotaxis protein methyltransferase CheR